MSDLFRLIFGLVVDLFRSRAAMASAPRAFGNRWQAQPRTTLSTARNGIRFGPKSCSNSTSFDRIPWFGGTVQVATPNIFALK